VSALTYCEVSSNGNYVDDVFVVLARHSILVCQLGEELKCYEFEDLDGATEKIEELAGENVSLYCRTPR